MAPRLIALLGLLASGCGMLGTSSREEMIRTIREFNNDLRWGRHEQVTPRLSQAARVRYLSHLQSVGEDLEVLDHEVINLELGKKGNLATARVDLSWTLRRVGIVEKTSVLQHWEYKNAEWIVLRQERLSGAQLGFFEEPKDRPKPPAPVSPQVSPPAAASPPGQ